MSPNDPIAETPRRGRKKAEPPKTEDAPSPALTVVADAPSSKETPAEPEPDAPVEAAPLVSDRQRIEEQLEALARKQAELRRALALADHPELAPTVRALEAHADSVAHADEKKKRGLSKAEEKKRDTLSKKLEGLRGKRAELDAQIAELVGELAPLGEERVALLDAERGAALAALAAALETHEREFQAAGLEVTLFVPELHRWTSELEAARSSGKAEVVG